MIRPVVTINDVLTSGKSVMCAIEAVILKDIVSRGMYFWCKGRKE